MTSSGTPIRLAEAHQAGGWHRLAITSVRGLSVLAAGATGGLGSPISRRLAQEGAQLALPGRDIRGLESLDLDASLVTGDLREPETAVRAAAAAIAGYGRLDGLVVASGVVAFGPVGERPDEAFVDLFLVNTLAPVRLLRAVLPHLAASARDGRSPLVVHLSAIAPPDLDLTHRDRTR